MLTFILKYWIEILFSLLISIITYLYRRITRYMKKINALEQHACLNLKNHILERYKKAKQKGYITLEEKEEIMELYNFYKNLECSNIVEQIIKELESIPIK